MAVGKEASVVSVHYFGEKLLVSFSQPRIISQSTLSSKSF